jgi:hypothetical protein
MLSSITNKGKNMSRKLLAKALESFDGDFPVMTPASVGGIVKPGAAIANAVKSFTISDFNGFSPVAEITGVMVDTGKSGKCSATYDDMKIKGDKLERAFEDLDDAIAAFNVSVGIHEAISSEEKSPADQKVLDQVALSMGILKDGQSLGTESLTETLKQWFIKIRDIIMDLIRKLMDYAQLFFMSIKGSKKDLEELLPRLDKLDGMRKANIFLTSDQVPTYMFMGNDLPENVNTIFSAMKMTMDVLREARPIAASPIRSFEMVNRAWKANYRDYHIDEEAREVVVDALKTQSHEWSSEICGIFNAKIKLKLGDNQDTFYPTFSSVPYLGNYRMHVSYPKVENLNLDHVGVDSVCEQFKRFDIGLIPCNSNSQAGQKFEIPTASRAYQLGKVLSELYEFATEVEDGLKGGTGQVARSWIAAENAIDYNYSSSVSTASANKRPVVHIRLLANISRTILNNMKVLMDMTHRTTRPVMYVLNQTTLSYLKA